MAILQDQTQAARIAQLEAQLAAAEARANGKISYKVSGKNAISAYGMGQFPVTLYAEQWDRLDADREARKAFILANDKIIAKKGAAPTPEMIAHAKKVAAEVAARPARK